MTDTGAAYRKSSQKSESYYPPPPISLERSWNIEVFSAKHLPERRQQYRDAADLSFIKWNIQAVGRSHAIADDSYATFIAEAKRGSDIIGGICVYLQDSEGRLPILDWLDGYVDTLLLHQHIRELSFEGVVHCAGFWADPEQKAPGLAGDIARALMVMIAALKVRYALGTCHQYTLQPFSSLGWKVLPGFSDFSFPDSRYKSYVLITDVQRWTPDLAKWAFAQGAGRVFDDPRVRLMINPFHTKSALIENSERKGVEA